MGGAFLCMGGKHFNGKCMEPFLHCTEAKIGMLEFQRETVMTILASFGRSNLQSHWSFHKMLQEMWSLITKITFLWKAHQNVVAVNTVVVDQSIYTRNAMLSYTLTVSRTIIREKQNLLYCFLPEALIMETEQLEIFLENFRDFVIVSLPSLIFCSSWKPLIS